VVRPLVHFREIGACLGVGVSRSAHASDVTHASLGVDIALGNASEFTEGRELSPDHDLSLRLGSADRLVKQRVELLPRDHVPVVGVKVLK
jgi:hypothetical protein